MKTKIFEYKNGSLTYDLLKQYLDGRIASAEKGSEMELNLRETLSEAENFDLNRRAKIRRAQLETQFAKNGISGAEKVAIEKEILQFFKEGSPEYSEQLSTIAAAQELARTEDNNAKVARLQASLSEGGLSTEDRIAVFKEMQRYTEKGSQEWADVQNEIGKLKEQRREEERQQERIMKESELYEKYGSGGITEEEALTITRELKAMYEPGSEEYLEYQKQEADILGQLAKGGGGNDKDQAAVEYFTYEKMIEDLKLQLQQGAVGLNDYYQKMEELTNAQMELTNQYGVDLPGREKGGELKARYLGLQTLKNAINSNSAVIVDVDGKKTPVASTDLAKYAVKANVMNENGELVEGDIVTIVDDNGQSKNVLLTQDGKNVYLDDVSDTNARGEPISKDGTTVYRTLGSRLILNPDTVTNKSGESTGTNTSTLSPTSATSATTFAPQSFATAPMSKTKTPSSSSGSKNSSSSKSKETKSSTPKINISPVVATVKNEASKVFKDYSPSRESQTGVKIGPVRVTRGIGLSPDFGVTEALKLGEKVNKAKSWIKNLFRW